jgi:hypothetical protein
VASHYVPPATGQVGVFVELIPRSIALQLDDAIEKGWVTQKVIVRMRAIGTLGGDTVRSGWAQFPVSICHFCLSNPTATCPAGLAATAVQMGGCFIQQDEPITCCCNHHSDPKTCDDTRCGASVPTGTGGDGGV